MGHSILTIANETGFSVNEMMLALCQRPSATWLWVEGPDDASILQPWCSDYCKTRIAGTRDKAIAIAKEAQRRGLVVGYLCLVDSDYTRFDPPDGRQASIPPRVVEVPHHPDIEGAIYYRHATQILKRIFFAHHLADELPWVRKTPPDASLDLLVRDVLAPLGAVRVAWRQIGLGHLRLGGSEFADRPRSDADSLVCQILRLTLEGSEESAKISAMRHLLPQVTDSDWHGLVLRAEELLKKYSCDLWSLVRGKDISVAVGWLAYNFPDAALFKHNSLNQAVITTHTLMRASTNEDWIADSGLADAFTRHLGPGERLDFYLSIRQTAAAAA